MDTNYILSNREYFLEKPENYEEILQICEMIHIKRNSFKKKKNIHKRRDRIQAIWQEDDPLMKSLNFIFNKLSENNLDIIFDETIRLLSLMKDYPEHLSFVIYNIFNRGVKTGYLIELYVKLFKKIIQVIDNIHPILISTCEYLFYTYFHDDKLNTICTFVSNMYIEELITSETLIYCLDILLSQKKYYEFCCLLERHIIEYHNNYQVKLDALFVDSSVSNKIKFKITDIYDLLKSK